MSHIVNLKDPNRRVTNITALQRAVARLGLTWEERNQFRYWGGAMQRGSRFVISASAKNSRNFEIGVMPLTDEAGEQYSLAADPMYSNLTPIVGETMMVDGQQIFAPKLFQEYRREELLMAAEDTGSQVEFETAKQADGSIRGRIFVPAMA